MAVVKRSPSAVVLEGLLFSHCGVASAERLAGSLVLPRVLARLEIMTSASSVVGVFGPVAGFVLLLWFIRLCPFFA